MDLPVFYSNVVIMSAQHDIFVLQHRVVARNHHNDVADHPGVKAYRHNLRQPRSEWVQATVAVGLQTYRLVLVQNVLACFGTAHAARQTALQAVAGQQVQMLPQPLLARLLRVGRVDTHRGHQRGDGNKNKNPFLSHNDYITKNHAFYCSATFVFLQIKTNSCLHYKNVRIFAQSNTEMQLCVNF